MIAENEAEYLYTEEAINRIERALRNANRETKDRGDKPRATGGQE